jgi:PAS domain S-box-containing protein
MMSQIESLQKRIQELETVEQEYKQMKALVEDAAKGENLEKYAGDMLLYSDPESQMIVDANDLALAFLGYSLEELRSLKITALEACENHEATIYNKSANPVENYECQYRHREGYDLPVRVRKRLIEKAGKSLWFYILEDKSLRKQLWRELSRREDSNFQFREQLKTLNEISLELGRISSTEDLCRRSIELGLERLGFDRLSIWLMDTSAEVMRGTFGVDEHGQIRDEREQSWSYVRSYVEDFLAGRREALVTHDDALLYNERSEVIAYGWHISVPLLDAQNFIGFMAVDNFIHKRPLESYQTDLLQLFGASIGNLLARQWEQETIRRLQLEQERFRFLENFVTSIAHEFKTPLAIINTSSYFLSKSREESKRQSHAANIEDSVAYLNHLLNVMLEMLKLDSLKDLNISALNMESFLPDILKNLMPLASSKPIQVQLQMQATQTLQADSALLWRALEEILKNAIEYTAANGTIEIRLTENQNQLRIGIHDTGIGIPEAELEKIFERFYRVDQSRSSRKAGLGLALAKRIIDLHHGEIHVKSTLGQGSLFEILLPLPE